ncbi:extracellular solute-binding protein [Anaerobacillus sp. CMMVII]|nr:extracellular solute-binding protein [Anaerobacillus sp. CMMVII]
MVPSGGYYLDHVRNYVAPKFTELHPDVNVIVEQEPDGGQLTARIAAGDIPDVLVGVFGYQPAKFARDNLIVDLKNMPGSQELFDRIAPQYIHEDFGGRYYVPWNATTQMMIYNKALFEQAGLDPNSPPETFEQYLEYAEKINNLGSNVYGNVFWNEALAWGGWYWTMNSQIYYNFNNAEYQLFNELGTDIIFDKEEAKLVEFYEFMEKAQAFAPSTMDGNEFFGRNVGMWLQFGYGWKANLQEAKDHPMVIGDDVGIAPIPVVNAGDTHWSTLDGRSLMVFRSNPEREQLAFELIKFMMEDEINLESLKALEQLPTLSSLVEDEYFKAEDIQPFVQQLQHTIPNEAVAELDDISNLLLQNYIKSIIQKEISVQQAVENAAAEARDILDR